jgi:hypothetical protein
LDCVQEDARLVRDLDPVIPVNWFAVTDRVGDQVAGARDSVRPGNLKAGAVNTLVIESIKVAEHMQMNW